MLLAQGGGRYLCLLLARDAQPHPCCSGLAQGGRKSPAGHFPGTSSEGLCSAFSSGLKWKHFKGLCLFFFFFLPFLFFSLQTINYKFKRKFQPSFPPQKFRGNKYKAAQCRNKIVHPVLSEIKVVVVWGWFFYFFFGVKCIIGVQCSCLDNELSGYLWINGKPASHR